MDSTNEPPTVQPHAPWIPEGYVLVTGPDEQPYVVPEFCVPALHHIFDGYRKKDQLQVVKASGSVSSNTGSIFSLYCRYADRQFDAGFMSFWPIC
jgi:hypothetical protein